VAEQPEGSPALWRQGARTVPSRGRRPVGQALAHNYRHGGRCDHHERHLGRGSLQTAVACVLWLVYEGQPDLAHRLRDEYLEQWGVHASTWNDTLDAMIAVSGRATQKRRTRWAGRRRRPEAVAPSPVRP
jgi:hypothetical protein